MLLNNDMKENMIVGIILASSAEPETKEELIEYVRSRDDHSMQACFRLGQMDGRDSIAQMLMGSSLYNCESTRGTVEAAVAMINKMETI